MDLPVKPAGQRPDLTARLAARVIERQRQNLLRSPQTICAVDATSVWLAGRRMTVFCSNDYLGLARHPLVVSALRDGAAAHGVGSTASHLVCGHHRVHEELQEAIADWTGRERALLFSSGYSANLGITQALLGRGDISVQDKLNHASLLDAARLAGAKLTRYPHGDLDAARRQLRAHPGAAALLVSDGVFSMDGDTAQLAELASLAESEQALLLIDDAHGMGVLGPRGAGSLAAAGLDQVRAPLLMGTLGKAIGCAGAFVAGPKAVIDGIAQLARSHIYTTALPPALAEAASVAVRLARDDDAGRAHLTALIARFRKGAQQLGLALLPSASPIQPLLVGEAEQALRAAAALAQRGLLVSAIRPPTVPSGSSRLRITLSAAHSETQIDQLLDALAETML